jgi:hypothetical protein
MTNWITKTAKDLLVVLLVYSRSSWDEFHANNFRQVEKMLKHYLAFWPVLFLGMTISRWPIVTSVVDCTENTKFHILSWFSWGPSPQTLIRLSCWCCVRTRGTLCWVTQDMFRSSDTILWQVPWLMPAAVTVGTAGTHQHCNFWILSSVLTVLGRLLCSSSSLLSLSCAKRSCPLSTAVQGFFAVHLLGHLKLLLVDLPKSWQSLTELGRAWQNLALFHCSHCDIVNLCLPQTLPWQQQLPFWILLMHTTASWWDMAPHILPSPAPPPPPPHTHTHTHFNSIWDYSLRTQALYWHTFKHSRLTAKWCEIIVFQCFFMWFFSVSEGTKVSNYYSHHWRHGNGCQSKCSTIVTSQTACTSRSYNTWFYSFHF